METRDQIYQSAGSISFTVSIQFVYSKVNYQVTKSGHLVFQLISLLSDQVMAPFGMPKGVHLSNFRKGQSKHSRTAYQLLNL